MYKTIVTRKSAAVFAALNRGDAGPLIEGLDRDIEHVMFGTHALSGERHQHHSVVSWYERLFRLLPDLHFDIDSVTVMGPPWRTTVAVQWRERSLGGSYVNQGVNLIKLRWGRVQVIRIYCDTQHLAQMLDRLAGDGIAEASAAPILDTAPDPARSSKPT